MGKRGPQPILPTDDERKRIRMYAGLGVPQEDIGKLVGRSVDWLAKHCREELDKGLAETKAKVGGAIVQAALKGNMTAAIFYAKTQMGWKETTVQEHTGKDGEAIKFEQVSDDATRFRSRLLSRIIPDPADRVSVDPKR